MEKNSILEERNRSESESEFFTPTIESNRIESRPKKKLKMSLRECKRERKRCWKALDASRKECRAKCWAWRTSPAYHALMGFDEPLKPSIYDVASPEFYRAVDALKDVRKILRHHPNPQAQAEVDEIQRELDEFPHHSYNDGAA